MAKQCSVYKGDSASSLGRIASNVVDLVVTSPPYGNLRLYGDVANTWGWEKFKVIANELVRTLKPHGVIAWNVNDECVNGGYSCTSMRQIIHFTDVLGLRLHQCIVWRKKNPMPHRCKNRYQPSYELVYILSKGEPKTFNPLMRECKNRGKEYIQKFQSQRGKGYERTVKGAVSNETIDNDVWDIATASSNEVSYTLKDGRKIRHTAVFPKELARRIICSYSNEGDAVLDPFLGSGTSGVVAVELGRNFIGCELNEDYYQMASERIDEKMKEYGYVSAEEFSKVSEEDILTSKQLVKMTLGKKHMNLYMQRVERDVYEKLGLSQLHYMKEPINKGAMCLLFSDLKGRNVAFVGLLNNPSRTYPNAVIVSRIIVFPQFQGRGLSVPILDKVGAMLQAKGLQLLINTEKKDFGERLDSSLCWKSTTYDKKERKYYGDDATHRNRKSGYMWRKRFVGKALHGYSEHFEKVSVLRERKHESAITNDVGRTLPQRQLFAPVGSFSSSRYTVITASPIVPHGASVGAFNEDIKPLRYATNSSSYQKGLNTVVYVYPDTS